MPKHLSKKEYTKASKKYALDKDPDGLGVKPILSKSKPTTELKEDKKKKVND